MIKKVTKFIRTLIAEISNDDLVTLAAALSYYTALSISPMLLITLWVMQMFGYGDQQQLIQEVASLMGQQAADAIKMIISSANNNPSAANIAGVIGLLTLLFSASAVFGQLQYSLNRIWNVQPPAKTSWAAWIKKRLLSFGMVISLGFVAVVSLVLDAAIAFVSENLGFLSDESFLVGILESSVALLVFTFFFSALFRLLPDTKLKWREVWKGALITAVLFAVGKEAIGIYLGQSSVGSAYGAAGSLIILLVWVYYSSLILFVGAEVTQLLNVKSLSNAKPARQSELSTSAVAAEQNSTNSKKAVNT
jgi:membrane protein